MNNFFAQSKVSEGWTGTRKALREL